MADHTLQHCFHCNRVFALDHLVPGEVIRPAIAATIQTRFPDWNRTKMLCNDCLDQFRSEYVEDALKEEIGELSQLEQEVITSLQEQDTLTQNLNENFERSATIG